MRSFFPATVSAVLFFALTAAAQEQKDQIFKDIKPPSDAKEVPEIHRGSEVVNGKTLYEWTRELRDKDPSVRERAIATIKVYGTDARQYASEVIKAIRDPDISLKVNAVITLGWIGMEEKDLKDGLTALIGLLEHQQGIVRYQAIVALGNLGEKANAAVPRLIPAALRDHQSWEIRQAATRALAQTGWMHNRDQSLLFDLRAFSAMVRVLADPCSAVRLEAIHGLITLGRPAKATDFALEQRALQSLIHERNDRQPKKIAIWARVALMRIENKISDAHVAAIVHELSSKDLDTRIEAAKALAIVGEGAHAHVSELITALEDKDARVIYWSCCGLAKMGRFGTAALPALERLTQHSDPAVRAVAARAIEEIKGGTKARNDEAPDQRRRASNKSQ
jgi:HEAT repeat protein